jgi:hypothetical protein
MTKPATSKPFGPTVAVEYKTPRKLSSQECETTQANIAFMKKTRAENPQWVNGLLDKAVGWTGLGTKNAITQWEREYRQGGCSNPKAK